MGPAVKLISGGLGLASEAISSHKQKKAARARAEGQDFSSGTAESSSHAARPSGTFALPPEYVENTQQDSSSLIARGQPVPAADRAADADGYPVAKGAHAADEYGEGFTDDDLSDHDDEAEWALDDAAEAVDPSPHEDVGRQASNNEYIEQVLKLAGPVPASRQHLAAPVILPQRRPRANLRGFVRAYAPVLETAGISQDCFLTFTRNFHEASKASPWINVVMLGAFAVGFVPEPAAQISSAVVSAAVGTAQELQKRHRSNTFLDSMNDQLFKPRGLYAMVVTYKPEASRPVDAQQLNISESIARYTGGDSGRMKETIKGLRLSSGTTYGELELPRAAALVYPALDNAAFGKDPQKKQNALKGAGSFIADYLDRRAQAKYAYQNPDSGLQYDTPVFASRFSGPNHAANNGSLLGLVTGGAIDKRPGREARRDRRNGRRLATGRSVKTSRGQGDEPKSMIRKVLRQNVLYLLVVDLPSDAEIALAREKLARGR